MHAAHHTGVRLRGRRIGAYDAVSGPWLREVGEMARWPLVVCARRERLVAASGEGSGRGLDRVKDGRVNADNDHLHWRRGAFLSGEVEAEQRATSLAHFQHELSG